MQRTTSALTATVLGAVLTASVAVARQAPAPDDAPPVGASSTKARTGPESATEAANSQLYGMSVTRGARYLLRNGLDYLSYQQYDRALKFLREAEARITDQKTRKVQMELNTAEVTALKQGIEAAQRGLRRASNAESPYALSDKSRPANGFTPAKPSTQVAARNSKANALNRSARAVPVAPRDLLGSDGDDQGQPVRLASGEKPVNDQPGEIDPTVRPGITNNVAARRPANTDASATLPETPQIPLVSRLPDLTAVNRPEQLVGADTQQVAIDRPAIVPGPETPVETGPSTAEPPRLAQAPALVPASSSTSAMAPVPSPAEDRPLALAKPVAVPALEGTPTAQPDQVSSLPVLVSPDAVPLTSDHPSDVPAGAVEPSVSGRSGPTGSNVGEAGSGSTLATQSSSPLPQTLAVSPTEAPAPGAPVSPKGPDQAPGLPISDGNSTSPAAAAAVVATSSRTTTTEPTDGLVAPVAASDAATPATKSPVIDLETVPLPSPDENSAQPVNSGGVPHQESADPAPAVAASPTTVVSAASPNSTSGTMSTSSGAGDDLPPLPADPGRSIPDATITDAPKTQPTQADIPSAGQPADDVLPPLPAEVSHTTPATPETVSLQAQATPTPTTGSTFPPANHAEQPAQSSEANGSQASSEPLPVLPTGNDTQPMPSAHGRQSTADAAPPVSPVAVSPADSASPAMTAVTPSTEIAQPDLNASPTQSSTANPSYPTTNPNLEPQPATTASTGVQNEPDVSSLPPALSGRALSSGTDAFIPDRANPPSTLKPELQREVERIARRQEEEMRRQAQNPTQPADAPRDTISSDLRTQTQMDISRAPSPAEARPIKAIPVPEDWVPLAPRNWAPQRKYWAAAATCHLPLYFQDPVLERYGHSVEQFVGPLGRFLTYPVDDPTQSTQRNQMLQPFFSAGLMGLQIIAWPYNLIMDPPWEAQYDLGYYRPGDSIPTDTYWLPLHGYGPPLRGSNY